MTHAPAPPNPECSETIARLLHTALLTAQQQRADLLTETAQTWLQATTPAVQRAKLVALLEQSSTVSELLQAVERMLAKLFIPAFQGTQPSRQILQRSQALIAPGPGRAVQTQDSHHPGPPHLAWAGLLLVDAENMTPPKTLEAFLQTVGRYPILHRLAFGNWRRLGRRDQVFYRRGYQMVHVPSGKNSADIKMSLDASLISLGNPSIREVFICSTDSDLLHLGHTLLNLGVTPYRVSRRYNSFAILNVAQQTTQMFHLAPPSSPPGPPPAVEQTDPEQSDFDPAEQPEHPVVIAPELVKVPTLGQMKGWLKVLIMQEQQANPGQLIPLDRLGQLFRDRNHISAHEALKANSGYRTLRQFLEDNPIFALSPLPDGRQIAVTLASPALESPPSLEPSASVSGTEPEGEGAPPPPITDAHSLEQALIKLLWQLSSGQADSQIQLSILAAYFTHVYQEPMSAVLKRIGEPKGLPKFLAKCRSLRVQKQGQDWRITLACVS